MTRRFTLVDVNGSTHGMYLSRDSAKDGALTADPDGPSVLKGCCEGDGAVCGGIAIGGGL